MKIGEFVKHHIKEIFTHCDNVEHDEINFLLDRQYSKKLFGISFPFCAELGNIEPSQSKRYWTETYVVRGKRVRVTSQWYESSIVPFLKYLESKQIAPVIDPVEFESNDNFKPEPFVIYPASIFRTKRRSTPRLRVNQDSRYRATHIGNAQNLFIRNILSSLGIESFNEEDWKSTKDYFANKCVYCGAETKLEIDHAIPMNKEKLGEHKLGNLVPSCQQCNNNKGGKDFREFLGENVASISKIEEYMDSKNYVPLIENEQMKTILDLAHKEVSALADRYITIINELFQSSAENQIRDTGEN
jgi:5-methylcytosine-specific restriction endonuclease McrA